MTRARTLADIADLNIDSNTLVIDATNNRVGLGTSTPATRLHLMMTGSANAVQRIQAGVNGYAAQLHLYGQNAGGSSYNAVKSFVNGDSTPQWEITGPEASAEDVMTLHTGGSEKVRIDGSGNVGFGTNSPSYRVHSVAGSGSGIAGYFHNSAGSGNATALIAKGGANNTGATFQVQDYNGNADFTVSGDGHATFSGLIKASDGSESAPSIVFSNDTNTGIYRKAGDKLGFVTGGVERMRITDLGRIEFEVPTNQTGSLQDQRIDWRNENNAGIMASIAVYREANPNAPASLVFRTSTNVDSASNSSDGEISEKMRIASNGRVSIGHNSSINDSTLGISNRNLTSNRCVAVHNAGGTSGYFNQIAFRNNADNGNVGEIVRVNNASVQYNTTSDARLKENVADMTGAIARVKQLAPKRYSWINENLDTANQDGFLAHEVQNVIAGAVSGTQNEVDDDGNPVYMQMDYSKLVPLLTAALQEAIARIEALEAGE